MAEATFSMFTPPARRALQGGLRLADPPPAAQPLAEKYRPRSLDEMVGQGCAVFRLQAFLEAPYSTAFLFEGPTGVGKTTAALCLAAELGAVEFGGLDVIKSGSQDADAVLHALNQLRFTPMLGSGWKVLVVDEADYMSPKAAQVWLSALEDLPPRSVIIFTTNNPGKFPDRFLDRCERVAFEDDAAAHAQDAQALADRVWHGETGRRDAPRAADLAGVADGAGRLSYRRVVRALEPLLAAAKAGRVTPRQAPAPEPGDPVDWHAQAARYRAGERLVDIGRSLGLSHNKVYSCLEKYAGVAFPKKKATVGCVD